MPIDHINIGALPQLSDDAAAQIQDFIHHVLDLFEARYGYQIERYYDARAQHNMRPPDTPKAIDDPPF